MHLCNLLFIVYKLSRTDTTGYNYFPLHKRPFVNVQGL